MDARPSSSQTAAAPPPCSIPGDSSVDFATALSRWRDINFVELQATLAQTALPLLEAQKAALLNRKKLAQQTRDFRKQPDDAKLDAIKPLLKAYQAEIDTLTKRSRTAGNAFLMVHSALVTAPDPYPLLEIVLEQAASLNDLDTAKAESAALTRENAELRAAAARRADDQRDAQRLQHRIAQLEADFERRLAERADAVEKETSAKCDERIRNLQERENDLTKSLHLVQEQLQDLKSRDESATARLLEQGHEVDERETRGKLAETELLSRDLERAQTRLESVERRNEQLRAEIESIKSGRQHSDRIDALTREMSQKDARIAQLQELIEAEQRQSQSSRQDAKRAAEEKAKAQREREAEVDSLRAKLARCADYDEIKRELEIVKMVEFSIEYGDDDDDEDREDDADGDGDKKWSGAGAKPLEALLLEKNRKLQDQLTGLRVAHDELNNTSTRSSSELDRLKKQVARLQSLNEKLENDLVSVGGGGVDGPSASTGPAAGSSGPLPTTSGAPSATAMSAEEMLAEMDRIASVPDSSSSQPNGTSPLTSVSTPHSLPPQQTQASHNDTSILPIITSQRDRFRARNAELEEELRRQFATISDLRSEIKTLQSDNLGLYEKLRYLQTYGNEAGGGSVRIGMETSTTGMRYPPTAGGEAAGRKSADAKYRTRYEESMSPWEKFKGREQSRALSSLTPPERLLHMLTKLVLSHRRMRLLFILYAVSLHLLVFGMLFEVGHSSSTSTCPVQGPASSRP